MDTALWETAIWVAFELGFLVFMVGDWISRWNWVPSVYLVPVKGTLGVWIKLCHSHLKLYCQNLCRTHTNKTWLCCGFCCGLKVRPHLEYCILTLRLPAQKEYGPIRTSPEGSCEDDQRCGAPLLWGQAEGAGVAQLGEEKALGRPHCGLPVPKGGCWKAGGGLLVTVCSDRTK